MGGPARLTGQGLNCGPWPGPSRNGLGLAGLGPGFNPLGRAGPWAAGFLETLSPTTYVQY